MTTDYRPMWRGLGLNLETHDVLLNVLGQAYQDIYLTQKGRPQGMEYLDRWSGYQGYIFKSERANC